MKTLALAIAIVCSSACFAQGPGLAVKADSPKVTVTAKGHDVRLILSDIFAQAKKSGVIQPNIQFSLYLSLQDTDFDKALDIVCRQAGLVSDFKDGVYYVHKPRPKVAVTSAPAIELTSARLPESVLQRRVSTKFSKTLLKTVIDEFSTQTKLKIELDSDIPAYRVDAFLHNTSLKYALDQITKAANLTYQMTDHETILITPVKTTLTH